MKKFSLVSTLLVMAIFVVCCGGNNDDDKKTSENSQSAETADSDNEKTDATTEETNQSNEEVDAETSATSKEEANEDDSNPENTTLSCKNDLCTDSSTNLMWSPKTTKYMSWDEAKDYCENLEENGYSDWHLPTISELRTLIQNCENTITGGTCQATDSCLSFECRDTSCGGCEKTATSNYSKLGDSGDFWSSSELSDENGAWYICFCHADVNIGSKDTKNRLRCVR
ncbi:DUF1566 domain-containing protein [bacterium]|nr:DUF1566 domain-containing protein [bacterium]